MLKRIILASPRGFCAGVERAISTVEKALEIYGKPVYVRHQIVHNQYVVSELEKRGAIFIEDFSEVPEGSNLILSAHGSRPDVMAEAKEKNLKVIDAVCPLVTKVHLEAVRYAREGYSIILIGHKNHQEVIGTMGYAPVELVGSVEDVKKLNIRNEKIAYVTQTTLSLDDTKEIVEALKEKYPNIASPPKEDICYATTNRQNAVKELAGIVDLVLVVGSPNSSNSNRLVETAKRHGVNSYLIPDERALNYGWLANISAVGITSGASVPEELTQIIVRALTGKFPSATLESLELIKENIHFPLPREILI
ncbi:MAG TPA: 4-hydroxy-3-methylbut-2-enyl diphosphate reductase [Candidatus Nanoarchaeia archaeon]|nr:4-hydroxy-3-methylbut-2-enyl diphosphate reductase [Candidatus Nanoarchaeia archaeon]